MLQTIKSTHLVVCHLLTYVTQFILSNVQIEQLTYTKTIQTYKFQIDVSIDVYH